MKVRVNVFFAAILFVAISFSPPFSSNASADDLQKIFDLLTSPKKETSKTPSDSQGKQTQGGLPDLFNIFKKQSAPQPASAAGKQKGYLTDALKDVDVGKEIEAKTVVLEKQLEKVFVKIRTYQAMNGAIWLSLGKSYKSLVNDLESFDKKGSSSVDSFIRQTKVKQNQQMELIGQVTLDASAGLSDSSETIQLNQKKNQQLREAVKYMIDSNPIVGCAFGDVINRQNAALDSLLNSYMQRLSQITQFQITASEIFANMAREFKSAEMEMRKAIDVFNEQSALVSLKAAEHMDILYARARELRTITKDSKQGTLYALLDNMPKVTPLLDEIQRLNGVYSSFQQLRAKLASQSAQINSLCQASGAEIQNSSQDLGEIGASFQQMWAGQVAEIRKIAKQRQVQVKDLSKVLKEEEKKNKALASKRSKKQEQQIKEMANDTFGEPIFE